MIIDQLEESLVLATTKMVQKRITAFLNIISKIVGAARKCDKSIFFENELRAVPRVPFHCGSESATFGTIFPFFKNRPPIWLGDITFSLCMAPSGLYKMAHTMVS